MKLCRDCPGRHSLMCCRRLEPTADIEPLPMMKAEAQLIGIQPGPCPSPPGIASSEARMIRWLTGVGEFDANDPCDESGMVVNAGRTLGL